MESPDESTVVLRAMRVARRRRRVADLEWFEALYRVYMAAFVVGGGILFLSGLVGDRPLSPGALDDVVARGPSMVGLAMAVAMWTGVRSGANGGPVSIEEAEVRHLLLAPVPRSLVLRMPFIQRLRSVMFAAALVGATAGQLLQRRLPGSGNSLLEWAFWGAISGACVGATYVTAAGLTHEFAPSRAKWTLSAGTAVLVAWQVAAAVPSYSVQGPFDAVGRLFLWPLDGDIVDALVLLVVAVASVVAVVAVGRFSLESLARRSALVSQMRFAVTLQDIRTIVLLRRQLGGEYSRTEPWIRPRSLWRRHPVVGRSVAGIARFPARRLARMAVVTAAGTTCAVFAWRGTTPMVVPAGVFAFLLGLEAIEPLSQEIDQPDRTDSLPVERGYLHLRLLVGPLMSMVPFAMLSSGVALMFETGATTAALCGIIVPVVMLTGLAGGTINAVMGAPDPVSNATGALALPPEVSGMGSVLRAAWPPAVACSGLVPLLSARWASQNNEHVIATAIRSSLAVCLLVGLVAGWVRQRDAIKQWFRNAQAGGKPATASTGSAPIAPGGQ